MTTTTMWKKSFWPLKTTRDNRIYRIKYFATTFSVEFSRVSFWPFAVLIVFVLSMLNLLLFSFCLEMCCQKRFLINVCVFYIYLLFFPYIVSGWGLALAIKSSFRGKKKINALELNVVFSFHFFLSLSFSCLDALPIDLTALFSHSISHYVCICLFWWTLSKCYTNLAIFTC